MMDERFDKPPYDARRAANLLLDLADEEGVGISNLSIQKLLYFAHARYLVIHKRPLVVGFFEAWKLGPVLPVVYNLFKPYGSEPIRSRAKRLNFKSGKEEDLPSITDRSIRKFMGRFFDDFGHLSSGQLVKIAHAKNGPWDHIVNESKNGAILGLRITDQVIKERFRFHKVFLDDLGLGLDGDEDSPLGGN